MEIRGVGSRRGSLIGLVLGLVLLLAGCISVGRDFPVPQSQDIKNGTTTKADLIRFFGEPTQVGMEDGDQTWTWALVRKGLSGTESKQLYIRFDNRGVVKSYSYTSNFPEELRRR